jgi:hypothetical protein
MLPLRAEVIDRIMAVVSGRVITLTDVTAARDLGLVATGSEPDVLGTVLAGLIDRDLMLAEVERFVPPEPTPEAINEHVQAIRAQFPSEEAFANVLARSGIDEARLRDTVRQSLLIQEYLDLRFTIPPPTDEEVRRYYVEHQDAFSTAGTVAPLETIRPRVIEVMTAARRLSLVNDWLAGLRRRADIVNLYTASPDSTR